MGKYEQFIKTISETKNDIQLLAKKKDLVMKEVLAEKERKIFESGLIGKIYELQNLARELEGRQFLIGDFEGYFVYSSTKAWMPNYNYLGYVYTYGSCGYHSGSIVLDTASSYKENKLVWLKLEGADCKAKLEIPNCDQMQTQNKILDFAFKYFDQYENLVLDYFYKEQIKLEQKKDKLNKQIKEIK